MIINIKNKEEEVTVFQTDNILDEDKKNLAHSIIAKVANLEILNEALVFASSTHRATLEELLVSCDYADSEPVNEEGTLIVE
jgi:hypothetical protein